MKILRIRNSYGLKIRKRLLLIIMAFIMTASAQAFISDSDSRQDIKVDTAIFMREAKMLQELLVNPGKEKYSKKDNPAVELMRFVRANQKKGDPRLQNHYNYDQYDKTTLGLLDMPESEFEKHPFLTEYVDSSRHGANSVLYIMLKEKASTKLFSNGKKKPKTVVTGRTSSGIDEAIDDANIDIMLEEFLREGNVYDDDVTILGNRFVSPLSAIGADFYKYFITDTLDVDGTRCIQLTFTPRNPESFSFMGNLYVEYGDSTGFVKRVSMKVPRTINLNYVDNLHIDQTFEKDAEGKRHKLTDEMNLDLCIAPGTQRFYARRVSHYSNFSNTKRKDLSKAYDMLGDILELDVPDGQNGDYWTTRRLEPLNSAEGNMDSLMGKLREIPFFFWTEKVLAILVNGYVKTGKPSKFDIGPINTLISYSSVEGVRFRLGGMTTANLSPNLFAGGYIAYGTRDRQWKYKAELEYSLVKKKYHSREFPVNSIRATYMYDLDMIGQHYHFTNPDNVFLSLKRMKDKLSTNRHLARIEYNLELANQLSFGVWGERVIQDATAWLPFIDGYGKNFKNYSRTALGIRVRYAPGERYVQEKNVRVPVNLDAPVFILSHEWGPKRLFGASFTTNKTEFSMQKRFWFSAFGYTDVILKGGIIWSQVQYPDLLWQNANLSYTIQPESYSLMNPMEFAMDRYAACDLTYWGNGVLFNRIPFVKKAKLREVIGFKGLVGSIRDKNRPERNPELFQFPEDAHSRYMGRRPYMEISAGIDNIFTILRIDYVWRLSYRNTPGADRSGLRVALHFSF